MSKLAIALLAASALAVPAVAAADTGHDKPHEKKPAKEAVKGKGKKAKKSTYVFKGVFTAPGTIEVLSGNARVRKGGFVGQAVTFDFATAKVVAADTNADLKVDVADVKDGDLVVVQARAPKGDELAEPLVARKLIDKTNAPVE
jgi:hypothetical protein